MRCCCPKRRQEPLLPIAQPGARARGTGLELSFTDKPASVLERAQPTPSTISSTRPVRAAAPSYEAKPGHSFQSGGGSFKSARNLDSFKSRNSQPDQDEDVFHDADFHESEDAVDADRALLAGLTKLEQDILLPLKARIEQEDGWELVSDSKGLECCRRRVECTNPGRERPILMWKLRQTMQGATPKEVFDLVMDGPRTPTWHRHVSSWREINRDHGAALLATCFKGVFPVSAREALEFRAVSDGAVEETGEYWIAFRSLGTLELDVPVAAKHERTYTCMAGYRIRPGAEPGTAEFTFLAHTDPGGSLSDRIVEMAGPKGGTDYVVDLQKGLNARRTG